MTPDPKCEGCAHYYQCCFMGETLYCCIYCLHGAEFNLPPRRRTAAGRFYKYKKCPYKSRYRWTSGDFYKTADAPPPRRATASAMAFSSSARSNRILAHLMHSILAILFARRKFLAKTFTESLHCVHISHL